MSLWPLVALAILWRLDGWISRWLSLRYPTRPDVAPMGPVVIPNDLEGMAMMESELHAQESVREAIREAYEKYRDWNKVRTALGVATLD